MQFYWERQYQDMENGANMTNYINHLHNMNKELMARLILEKGYYVCNYYDETYGCSIDQDNDIDEEHCVEGVMWYLDHEVDNG